MIVIEAATPAQFAAGLALRFAVFVDEQGVRPEAERDALDDDPSTLHMIAVTDAEPNPLAPATENTVGVGRLLAPGTDGHPHIGRVAVAADARRGGVGRAVMDALESAAFARYGHGGSVTVALSAQVQAIPFYVDLGYTVAGEPYLDEEIWHRDATKVISVAV